MYYCECKQKEACVFSALQHHYGVLPGTYQQIHINDRYHSLCRNLMHMATLVLSSHHSTSLNPLPTTTCTASGGGSQLIPHAPLVVSSSSTDFKTVLLTWVCGPLCSGYQCNIHCVHGQRLWHITSGQDLVLIVTPSPS